MKIAKSRQKETKPSSPTSPFMNLSHNRFKIHHRKRTFIKIKVTPSWNSPTSNTNQSSTSTLVNAVKNLILQESTSSGTSKITSILLKKRTNQEIMIQKQISPSSSINSRCSTTPGMSKGHPSCGSLSPMWSWLLRISTIGSRKRV